MTLIRMSAVDEEGGAVSKKKQVLELESKAARSSAVPWAPTEIRIEDVEGPDELDPLA